MMGDIQEYFINHKVRNYYSVSISGYHIAEAGANPISQLAFTLPMALLWWSTIDLEEWTSTSLLQTSLSSSLTEWIRSIPSLVV